MGKYTPTIDSVALLTNIENIDFTNPEKIKTETNISLEKATQYHEIGGHVFLTKRSSYWIMLFLNNFYSFMIFTRMLQIVEAGLVKTKMERLKKDALDLILTHESCLSLHNRWTILQETMANVRLMVLKQNQNTKNENNDNIINLLIDGNKTKLGYIKYLTEISELILEELGVVNGWNLLTNIAFHASSPNLVKDYINKTPKTPEEIKEIKKCALENDIKINSEDPGYEDPTARFVEMIEVAAKCIDQIKKSFKRNVSPKEISLNIASICGLEVNTLENQTEQLTDQIKIITEALKTNEAAIYFQDETSKFLNFLKVLYEEDNPTLTFINDIKSGKITFSVNPILIKYRESGSYMFTDILKNQFLKGLESNKDVIVCFGNRVSCCSLKCEDCRINHGLKLTKDLYQIISDFSYDELRMEALNWDRIRETILK